MVAGLLEVVVVGGVGVVGVGLLVWVGGSVGVFGELGVGLGFRIHE